MRCTYCDTPRSWQTTSQATLHFPHGQQAMDNPLTSAVLLSALESMADQHGTTLTDTVLAVTGGEPLLHSAFLNQWLPAFPGSALLETAGILPDQLRDVLPHFDYLSLDWKDPADLRQGVDALAADQCLQLAVAQKERRAVFQFWTKLIVGAQTCMEWLGKSLRQIAQTAPDSSVFLQPVSPQKNGSTAPAPGELLRVLLEWRHLPLDLRVIPQVHPLLGVR